LYIFVFYRSLSVKSKSISLNIDIDSFLINHLPGAEFILKRRINKAFHEVCEFSVTELDKVFEKLPIVWDVKLLRNAIGLDYALPEDPIVLDTGFASFGLLGSFVALKYPTLYPPFNVDPVLPLSYSSSLSPFSSYSSASILRSPQHISVRSATSTTPPREERGVLTHATTSHTSGSGQDSEAEKVKAEYEGVKHITTLEAAPPIDLPPQVQIMLSEFTFNSLGWALQEIDALNMNITQKDIPSRFVQTPK
tara:strand:- start:366 stop:1118 length:753 start_codon:yes stop_codon:yes gene_type:complete